MKMMNSMGNENELQEAVNEFSTILSMFDVPATKETLKPYQEHIRIIAENIRAGKMHVINDSFAIFSKNANNEAKISGKCIIEILMNNLMVKSRVDVGLLFYVLMLHTVLKIDEEFSRD